MKKQARIDIRDASEIDLGWYPIKEKLKERLRRFSDAFYNKTTPEGEKALADLASITGDSSGALFRTPMKLKGLGELQKVIDAYNQYYPEMSTQVQLGMIDTARNRARRDALNLTPFMQGVGEVSLNDTVAKAMEAVRSDHFMPTSNTVHIFNENPSILAHELGHAADFTFRHKGSPGRMLAESSGINALIPTLGLGTLDQEMAATSNAYKALSKVEGSENILKNLSRDLGGAGGTYAGRSGGRALGLVAGAPLGAAASVALGGSPVAFWTTLDAMGSLGSTFGRDVGSYIGRNVGKQVDIPKYLMSTTLPDPKPVKERLKLHLADILNDIKTKNIFKYPGDSINSTRYVYNDLKELLKPKMNNFMNKLKAYASKLKTRGI